MQVCLGLCKLVGSKEFQDLCLQGIVEGPYLKFFDGMFGIWLIFEISNLSTLRVGIKRNSLIPPVRWRARGINCHLGVH